MPFTVIGVHGFEFDPSDPDESPAELYRLWADHCGGPFVGHP